MENASSNKGNNTGSPSTSPQHPSSSPTNDEPHSILKTPEEVLADLTTSDNDNNSGESPPPPTPTPPVVGEEGQSGRGVGSMMAMVGVGRGGGGGGVVVVGGGVGPAVGDVGGAAKKRKASAVKDPPTGTPTCPVCNRTFSSWKGAFGHMRKHPDRDYRGFFRPPTFSSSPSKTVAGGASSDRGEGGSSGQGKSGEGGSSSPPVRGLVFDLNQPVEDAGNREENNVDEANKLGFDLNEFPATEDDEDKP